MLETYNYRIINGSWSGRVVAGRPTENQSIRVVILAHKKDNKGNALSEQSVTYLVNMANGNTHHHNLKPAESNSQKRMPVPVGNILDGGLGTSVKCLVHTEPAGTVT